MVNTVTGERVVYRGALGGHMRVTWSENWLRYDYVHSEMTFPLVARIIQSGRGVSGDGRLECLSVDYPRSARLWRDDPFGNRVVGTSPAYGVWRRVDDCIVDAFSCWPEEATGGWAGGWVELVGGWLNGSWRPDFSRMSRGGPDLERWLASAEPPKRDHRPTLTDLWSKPSPSWTVPALNSPDAGRAASGRREPLLVTADGGLAIYAPQDRQNPLPEALILSLEDRAAGRTDTFIVEAGAYAGQWLVHFAGRPTDASAPETFDYDAWLKGHWSMIDAFGAWRTKPPASADRSGPVVAEAPDAIRLENCYRGGIRVPAAHCYIFYAY